MRVTAVPLSITLPLPLPLPLQTSANCRTDNASSCSNGNATPATRFHGDHSWWQPTGRARSIKQRQWNPEGQGDNTHTHQTAKMAQTRSRCKMNNEYYCIHSIECHFLFDFAFPLPPCRILLAAGTPTWSASLECLFPFFLSAISLISFTNQEQSIHTTCGQLAAQ